MPAIIKNISQQLSSIWSGVLKTYDELSAIYLNYFLIVALIVGWRLRRHELITPLHGLGLYIAYFGTLMFIVLFVYPLRKRVKSLAVIGTIKYWFNFHMMLGLAGPVVILFHCNFHLGALNSNIALISLLIVSASGIVGKHIYGKITMGLKGERTTLMELQKTFDKAVEESAPQFSLIPGIYEEMVSFASQVITPTKVLMVSFRRVFEIRRQSFATRSRVKQIIDAFIAEHSAQHHWSVHRSQQVRAFMQRKTKRFMGQAIRVATFNFYERLFYRWHDLHQPLTIVFVITVIIHVFSVNRY